ncbi:MAG TPA: hypothetical protein VIM30_14055 [Candidatus Limnocylindrales bacterium]
MTLATAGCGPAGRGASPAMNVTYPPASAGPVLASDPAVQELRTRLATGLAARGLLLADANVPYRPAEAAPFAAAPRAVFQVQLPADPTGGFVSIYAFADTAAATSAARAQADFLATGPVRVQSALGTMQVIRIVGTNVIYFHWLPAAADPSESGIQAVLETIGTPAIVPS